MRITINNREIEFSGGTLINLLEENEFLEKTGLAVAVNETVIPRDEWGSLTLKEKDSILVIIPVQGG